jgi:hypothetical protein
VSEIIAKLMQKYGISKEKFIEDKRSMESILRTKLDSLSKEIYELCMLMWIRSRTYMGNPSEYLETCKDLIIEQAIDLLTIESIIYWIIQKSSK